MCTNYLTLSLLLLFVCIFNITVEKEAVKSNLIMRVQVIIIEQISMREN